MKFALVHSLHPVDAQIETGNIEAKLSDVDIGGFFYDYLLNEFDQLVGVRYYWFAEDRKIHEGPLGMFHDDPRFCFNLNEGFVDIVFYAKDVPALHAGTLDFDGAQDFGGDGVLNLDGHFAILFDLPDDLSRKD